MSGIPQLPSPHMGPPPGLMAATGAARPGIGPSPAPNANPGNVFAAMTKIKNALVMIEESLPQIPMGSELHSEVLKIAQSLSRHLKDAGSNPANEMQSLLQTARHSAESMPMQALQRMFPQGQHPPALPGAPPAGPPMGAAPPGMTGA